MKIMTSALEGEVQSVQHSHLEGRLGGGRLCSTVSSAETRWIGSARRVIPESVSGMQSQTHKVRVVARDLVSFLGAKKESDNFEVGRLTRFCLPARVPGRPS